MDLQEIKEHRATRLVSTLTGVSPDRVAEQTLQLTAEFGGTDEETLMAAVIAAMITVGVIEPDHG